MQCVETTRLRGGFPVVSPVHQLGSELSKLCPHNHGRSHTQTHTRHSSNNDAGADTVHHMYNYIIDQPLNDNLSEIICLNRCGNTVQISDDPTWCTYEDAELV